jgi:DNA (cytosine-5)-methyltransferase 1
MDSFEKAWGGVTAYYNEIDPYAAQWLRNLISAGLIADGLVDERSIIDVQPSELAGFMQCHFFAGIAGWDYALRLAGWPDDRPVWTGSCPCQPFSTAGQGKAANDKRHLWPAWFSLISECKPAIIFGEQVAAAIGWGWLDLVFADLEAEGYACGTAVLPACSIGAPHIRNRLWFVADANAARYGGELGDTEHRGCKGWNEAWERASSTLSPSASFWCGLEWILCQDGKARPAKPGIFPLAYGVPAIVGKLRAAGNAIVPQVAAKFINAAMS